MHSSLFLLPPERFLPLVVFLRYTSRVSNRPSWNGILSLGRCVATATEASLIISYNHALMPYLRTTLRHPVRNSASWPIWNRSSIIISMSRFTGHDVPPNKSSASSCTTSSNRESGPSMPCSRRIRSMSAKQRPELYRSNRSISRSNVRRKACSSMLNGVATATVICNSFVVEMHLLSHIRPSLRHGPLKKVDKWTIPAYPHPRICL